MLREVLEALQPKPGGRYVDGTLGGGGHAAALLAASAPSGFLFGCDRDAAALEAARQRLAPLAGRCALRQGNFAELADWIEHRSCQGVLLDLGVSSPQLDEPERGFSFQQEGPLDMRMDQRQSLTAAGLDNDLSERELADLFWKLGDEPHGRRLARAIVQARRQGPVETTGQLARIIERVSPRQGRKRHPATRVFQALRMTVNNEVCSLKRGLAAACTLLQPGGRLAVITFHSVEDRIVKHFGHEKIRDYAVTGEVDLPEFRVPRPPQMRWLYRKPLDASELEVESNPRARSAKLRVLEQL